ncbi:unnamed protein product [Peniophora sp. CBMAI 1063]|nr:unnamed protein product [Peniophora sp. CBMAI 1063]
MSVAQIPPPPAVQVQRETSEAEDSNSDFLSVKLVNPRARVKLSAPLDLTPFPSSGHLFAIAPHARHFAAITANCVLAVSPLDDLRAALYGADDGDGGTFACKRTVDLGGWGVPHYILFACGDRRLLVGYVQGPVQVFDAQTLFTAGSGDVQPLHTFPSTTSTAVRQMHANPNAEAGLSELVAVLREPDGSGDSLLVEVVDVVGMKSVCGWRGGGTSETFPTSLSWSPKGKQLALGLQSGSLLTFTPSAPSTPKSFVPSPPPASFPPPFNTSPTPLALLHTSWLSTPDFYGIYAPPGATADPNVEQAHVVVTYDAKRPDVARDVVLPINFFTSGLRPPGAFVVCLRGWEPMRLLLVVGDTTSADIALVSLVAENGVEAWKRLSLEDAATPSMPLDTESNETVLLGLELDAHNDRPYTHATPSGEGLEVPPPPIVLAYASDGTVLGWHVVNTTGTRYPGMAAATAAASVGMQPEPQPVQQQASGGSTGGFGAFAGNGASAFGQSAFGQAAAKPTSGFGQSAFGATGFGQTSQPAQSSGSAFGGGGSAGGGAFAAFASKPAAFGQSGFGSSTPSPSAFGQTGFGSSTPSAFGASSTSSSAFGQPREPAPQMEQSNSVNMADDNVMGGLSMGLGGEGSTEGKTNAAFGAFGGGGSSGGGGGAFGGSNGGSAFGTSGTGAFGGGGGGPSAFAAAAQKGSVFGQPTQPTSAFSAGGSSGGAFSSAPSQPAPAFGQSSFGSATTGSGAGTGKPAFGQSGFAAKAAFGQSGFSGGAGTGSPMSTTPISATAPSGGAFSAFAGGTTAFGKPAAPAPTSTTTTAPTAAPSGGGFGAFASAGPSAFEQAGAGGGGGGKPAWRTEGEGEMKAAPVFGGSGAGGAGSGSVFGSSTTSGSVFGSTTPTAAPPASSATEPRTPAPLAAPAFGSPSSPTPNSPLSPPDTPVQANATTTTPAGPPQSFKPTPSPAPATVDPSTTTPAGPPPSSTFAHLARPSAFTSSTNAFGAALNKDSPFARAASGANAPLVNNAFSGSAFALPTSTTPTSAPGFGAGAGGGGSVFGKSAFSGLGKDSPFAAKGAKESTTTPKETPPPSAAASSAFSAFGGSVSAFGKVGGGSKGKSFSEMLKEGGGEGGDKNEGKEGKEEGKKPASAFPAVKSAFAVSIAGKDAGEGGGKGKGVKKEDSAGSLADSYVDVREEDAGSDEEPEGSGSEDEGSQGPGGRDEIDDFLSDDEEGEEEEEGDEEYDEEEEEEHEVEEGLEDIPEEDEEPTTTMPALKLEPPTPDKKGKIKGQSTTPPGSPSRSPSPTPSTKIAQPTPTLPGSSSTIGLGRPSSRPTRSSPLASTVSSASDGGDPSKSDSSKPDDKPNKPRPASPKTPFGMLPPTAPKLKVSPSALTAELPADKEEMKKPSPVAGRPKTPPATALFGFGGSKPASTATAAPGVANKEGASPVLAPSPSTPSLFGGFKPGGLFGAPPSQATPPSQPQQPQTAHKLFNPPPPLGQGSLFGAPPTPVSSTSKPSTPVPAPVQPEEKLEPLQAEFLNLFLGLNKELEELGALAQDAERRTQEMINPPPAPPGRVVPTMDMVQSVGKQVHGLVDDLEYLRTSFEEDQGFVRELETGLLRAKTRKEVVAKFDAAKDDEGYSRIMKSQSLNPDHSEQQTQLRRSIRTITERVAQLEGKLQADKRRLEETRLGKSRIKPPSLDTVNRTLRNIDMTIEQQSAEIAGLSARVSKLDLATSRRPSRARSHRDRATPEPTPRPRAVTPSIAERTAAALTAERAAFKLKAALLNARSEPLLNTKALNAPPALHAFADPSRPAPISAPSASDFFSTPFTLPPLSVSGDLTAPGPTAGRKRMASATHQKSVQIKPHAAPVAGIGATPTPLGSALPKPPAFDWGPLPGVKPATSLAADLRTPPKMGR